MTATGTLFIALRIPEIQHFPTFLETLNESPILFLLKVGTYVNTGSGRYYYQQLFLNSLSLPRRYPLGQDILVKSVTRNYSKIELFLENLHSFRSTICRNTSDWLLANLKIILDKKTLKKPDRFLVSFLKQYWNFLEKENSIRWRCLWKISLRNMQSK